MLYIHSKLKKENYYNPDINPTFMTSGWKVVSTAVSVVNKVCNPTSITPTCLCGGSLCLHHVKAEKLQSGMCS